MVYMTPVLFNVETGEEIRKDEFRNVNTASCYWGKDPGILYIENGKRGYQQIDLYSYDAKTKVQTLLYTEKSNTNIDNFDWWLEDEWEKMILTSEKDGWKQLYMLNNKDKIPDRILLCPRLFIRSLLISDLLETLHDT